MADRPRLPPSGLAEDLIPLLRGAPSVVNPAATGTPDPAQPPSPVLAFADRVAEDDPPPVVRQRRRSVVQFELAGAAYALPTSRVLEVMRVGSVTRVPNAPASVRGVTNARGRALAVVDVRRCLGLPALDVDKHARIVAVQSAGRMVGLLVDRVVSVIRIAVGPAGDGDPAPVVARGDDPHGELRVLSVDALLEVSE